uniref:Secreted protein n=1 Tax=Anopheles darlingi TaxID=43151 RepID=A0A2M4D6R4_ANODA
MTSSVAATCLSWIRACVCLRSSTFCDRTKPDASPVAVGRSRGVLGNVKCSSININVEPVSLQPAYAPLPLHSSAIILLHTGSFLLHYSVLSRPRR